MQQELCLEEYEKLTQTYRNTAPEIVASALEAITPYIYSKEGKGKVLKEYEKLKDIIPPTTLLHLSSFFEGMGDVSSALEALQRIKEQHPDSDASTEALICEGKCFLYRGMKSKARESFQRARQAKGKTFVSATAGFWLALLENSYP